MTGALQGTDIATASTFLKDATEVTVRNRPLLGFLEEEGRINKNATGKDLNWLLEYKLPVATPYVPNQVLSFANDNYNLPASVAPAFWIDTSGMNWVDIKMNSGPTVLVDNYMRRARLMLTAMQIKLAKDLYSYAPANPQGVIGIQTLQARSTTLVCTNADRIAVPLAGIVYAGLALAPASYGGSWSNLLQGTGQQMSTVLGSDWPDGQGSPDQLYDGTTPRLYNENTNQWLTPGTAPANGTWFQNCIPMLSRSNTDLGQNSVKTMMPNLHVSGSGRHQAIKDSLRLSFRDIQQNNRSAEMLGYTDSINYEGAAIITDHECPPDRTISYCAASMDLFFYGDDADNTDGRGGAAMGVSQGAAESAQQITGGIYTVFGPTHVPGSLDWVWIMVAGGNARYNPRWTACHKDFTTGI